MWRSGLLRLSPSIPRSRMPRFRMPRSRATMMRPFSRTKAATAKDVHNEVADGDDYSCDSVDDGNEHLHDGHASTRAGGRRGGERTFAMALMMALIPWPMEETTEPWKVVSSAVGVFQGDVCSPW